MSVPRYALIAELFSLERGAYAVAMFSPLRPSLVAVPFVGLFVAACEHGRSMQPADPADRAIAASPLSVDPEIAVIRDAVDAARITRSVTKLASFPTRNTCSGSAGIGAAREWIREQFASIPGLVVALDPFEYARCPDEMRPAHNVVASLPGRSPERLILIGGHYDSRSANNLDGTMLAPGANDSGSQTALVLEAARVMAGHTYGATLVFVAFAGEEQGLLGSSTLAEGYEKYFPGAKIEAVLNCDIVGGDRSANDPARLKQFRLFSPGTPRERGQSAGTTDNTSPSRGLMRFVERAGSAYVPAMMMSPQLREDRPGRGGDQTSFIARGIPGVRFIETAENVAHQHSSEDVLANMTPEYTARITQIVVATAASLARAPSPPSGLVASGGGRLPIVLRWSPSRGADHYVVAARSARQSFYRGPFLATQGTELQLGSPAADFGVREGQAFFVSVAAVDADGHESLFAYPEYRCDTSGCVVPAGANDVTATTR